MNTFLFLATMFPKMGIFFLHSLCRLISKTDASPFSLIPLNSIFLEVSALDSIGCASFPQNFQVSRCWSSRDKCSGGCRLYCCLCPHLHTTRFTLREVRCLQIAMKILTFKQRHEALQLESRARFSRRKERRREKKQTRGHGREVWLKVLTSRMFNFTANMVSHIKRVSGSNKPSASAVKWHQSGRGQVSSLASHGMRPR